MTKEGQELEFVAGYHENFNASTHGDFEPVELNQLANLGEFIGGVAVLVTLAHLVVQVRQSHAVRVWDQ